MLISIKIIKGTDINKRVNISPVGVIIAEIIKIATMNSALCLVSVDMFTTPSLIKKNTNKGI